MLPCCISIHWFFGSHWVHYVNTWSSGELKSVKLIVSSWVWTRTRQLGACASERRINRCSVSGRIGPWKVKNKKSCHAHILRSWQGYFFWIKKNHPTSNTFSILLNLPYPSDKFLPTSRNFLINDVKIKKPPSL